MKPVFIFIKNKIKILLCLGDNLQKFIKPLVGILLRRDNPHRDIQVLKKINDMTTMLTDKVVKIGKVTEQYLLNRFCFVYIFFPGNAGHGKI